MKIKILLLLYVCMLLTACKDNNAPKTTEELKEYSIGIVKEFIEGLYGDDSDIDDLCHKTIIGSDDFDTELWTIAEAARTAKVKLDPQKVSYCSEIKEIKDKSKLKYAAVKVKYEGKEIRFLVHFHSSGSSAETGTEGKPCIYSTMGLVKFDNRSFYKKNGFVLDWDSTLDDLVPYVNWIKAVEAFRLVVKEKNISPDKVSIRSDWRTSEESDGCYEVLEGDSIVITVKGNEIVSTKGIGEVDIL